ncbi:hypothetical protein OAF30_00150 [Flavobacteriales bacterium]|nr:hypothetical protein [Flavobacteriales bacterium]
MIAFSAIFHHDADMSPYTDKLKVRDFIAKTIGTRFLSEISQIANRVEDLDLEKAVGCFIKTNHDSGGHFQLKAISQKEEAKEKMRKHLNIKDYGSQKGEYMYHGITPKVYVESPFFPQPNQPNLKVWRIFFYRGKNVLIQVNECRFAPDLTHIYSPDFTPIIRYSHKRGDALIESEKLLPITSHITEKGVRQMIALGEKCTADFHFCRFDAFDTTEGIKFSELTFMPQSGCFNEEVSQILGKEMMQHAPSFFKVP